MANVNLFKGGNKAIKSAAVKPNTVNKAGGSAFSLDAEAALAQYACTGTFNDTFYSDAKTQLKETLELTQKVSPEFIAKLAVYSREKSFMKDMPAFLLAVLSTRDIDLFKKTFNRIVDNGKMLRNFVQIMRSGVVGRRSLGSAPKKAIKRWLSSRRDNQLFRDSVGQNPSLADILKMVHPTPETKHQEAFYAYLLGKTLTVEQYEILPSVVKNYEDLKKGTLSGDLPDVDFRMLTSLPLTEKQWKAIATKAQWMMTRMNLNTFERHGVFKDAAMVDLVASRLSNKSDIQKAKAFPYQLLSAYINAGTVPTKIKNALQQAMEIAVENVPAYSGKVYVMIDVSGSMSSPVTGYRGSSTSAVTCKDVAALVASSVLRKNVNAEVILFHTSAWKENLNAFDSIMTNTKKIMKAPGGGTDCSAPLALLNKQKAKGDLIIMVSDCESWAHAPGSYMQAEWEVFQQRNRQAKLVCIDIQASSTTQAASTKNTLNVGGFSDQVFEVINSFVEETGTKTFWTDKINEVAL